ncbi:thymidylate kinase-like protein [Choanephora cucurbitarum]|nr:thymidylate kinase-like protein [Choanephora cucurbitarum]
MVQRGLFIVVEGCDRSGKTTQCDILVNKLNQHGMATELVKFPDRTTQTGKMIDSYLQQKSELDDHAIHLLFSSNRWEAMKDLKAKLDQGTTLVVDRYAFSGVAFSSAKGLDLDWCKQPDVGLLSPDLVLFLDLTIDEAEKRGGFGEERYEKRELQIKVREEFFKLKEDNWKVNRVYENHRWIINIIYQFIEASQSKEKVEQAIWETVQEFRKTDLKELHYDLWK